MEKIMDIQEGTVMVVSDIHGNLRDYEQVMRIYQEIEPDNLVIAGDLIHGYPGYPDRSQEIIDNLIARQDDSIVPLLGNQEFPHIYHGDINKQGVSVTAPFEAAIKGERAKYIGYFKSMPFAVRTAGGVLINHSGASNVYDMPIPFSLEAIMNWSHEDVLKNCGDSPDIWDEFKQTPEKKFLWEFLMEKKKHPQTLMINRFLSFMSGEKKLNTIVCGHIHPEDGSRTDNSNRILWLTSSYGTKDKQYLLFDASEHYVASELETKCHDLYASGEGFLPRVSDFLHYLLGM